MPDPITYSSASPRYGLPLLFSGQAQKEFYVNQAHCLVDALLHAAIEGEANDPPAAPAEGECWLIGDAPSDAWAGRAGQLACRSSGDWLFAAPRSGMRLLDLSTGQLRLYRGGAWSLAAAIEAPAGGATVDTQARAAIAELIAALADSGIIPG